MRGITVKADTYATLAITGINQGLYNSSVRPRESDETLMSDYQYTTNFLLQSITETRNEKTQLVTTFGATYAFFFGEQPRILNCSAILLNAANFDWEREWWANYSEFLRGTSLAALNAKATLEYDGYVITGYLTNSTTIKQASDPQVVQLNFSMFVESVSGMDGVGDTRAVAMGARQNAELLGVGDATGRSAESYTSTTAAVRKANIALQQQGGFLGFVSKAAGAISDAGALLDQGIHKMRNMLYGRNLILPVGYTSARASVPIFPEGTGVDDLAGQTFSTGTFTGDLSFISTDANPSPGAHNIVVRSNTDGYLGTDARTSKFQTEAQHYYQNFDEYVNYPPNTTADALTEALLSESVIDQAAVGYPLNASAVSAFTAMGLSKHVKPLTDLGDPFTTAMTLNKAAVAQEVAFTVINTLARVAYGGMVMAIGDSIVNSRKELQDSIENPNSGNLDAAVLESTLASMTEESLSAEQERLVNEAQANNNTVYKPTQSASDSEVADLRGETGTTYNVAEAILSTIL